MVTMEGCHWERKVILLLISVFHRDQSGSRMVRARVTQLLCAALGDQPGSQMVRARVTQLLCEALGGRAGVETWEDRSWAGSAAFPQWRSGGCPVGEEQAQNCQRHQRHSHGTLRSLEEDFEKTLHRQKG